MPAEPRGDELVDVLALRANGLEPRLRNLVPKDNHPLWSREVREANFQADLKLNVRGVECGSCGHLKGLNSFRKLRKAPDPIEWDGICIACRAETSKYRLKLAQRERRIEKTVPSERRALERTVARVRASQARLSVRERKVRSEAQKREKRKAHRKRVFAEGSPEAQRELMARELCRRNLTRFVQRFEGLELVGDEDASRMQDSGKGFHIGAFHSFVLHKLQVFLARLMAGMDPKLMLFTPPRHGKSSMASRLFPAWALGNYPELEIIAASYGSALPLEFSRFVRTLVADPAYQAIFPNTVLRSDKQQLTGWGTTRGGQYLPAGVGTGIAGRGADIFLIDDPVKDQDEADSETIQQRNLEWYLAAANSRLSPRSGQCIIQTRWSDNDISGFLERAMQEELKEHHEGFGEEAEHLRATYQGDALKEAMADWGRRRVKDLELIDQWEIVRFPAIAVQDEYLLKKQVELPDGTLLDDEDLVYEPVEGATLIRREGEALHPERYNERRLRRTERTIKRQGMDRIWNALYQQQPSEGASLHFKRGMFQVEAPLAGHQYAGWTILQVWDPAIGEKQQNDWTAGGTAALDFEGNLHVLHMQRLRGGPADIAKAIVAEYEAYEDTTAKGVFALGIEHGQISMALEDSLQHALDEANKERLKAGKDKLNVPPYLRDEQALKPVTDKLVRASPSQGWHRSGRVRYRRDMDHLEQLVREHTGFMAGYRWDDCVDFMSWMVRVARQAPVPRRQDNKTLTPYQGGYKSFRKRLAETLALQGGARHWQGS